MSAEAKFYPNTRQGREAALDAAFNTSNIAGFAGVLTPATLLRLQTMKTDYAAKLLQFAAKKSALSVLVAEKEKTRKSLKLYVLHFIKGLNMSIRREEQPPSVRAFYSLPVEHEQAPKMQEEFDVIQWAKACVTGDALRLGAGYPPMSNPSIADVQSRLTTMTGYFTQIRQAKNDLKQARKAVQKLNTEADRLIRKIWREVEVYHSEQPRPSMRRHARRWGVVYARKGGEKQVTGMVADKETGELLTGVQIKFIKGRNKVLTGAGGEFIINTTLMKKQKLSATFQGYKPVVVSITLKENKDVEYEIVMERLADSTG